MESRFIILPNFLAITSKSPPLRSLSLFFPDLSIFFRSNPSKIYIVFFSDKRLQGDHTKSINHYARPTDLESIQLTLDSRTICHFEPPTCNTEQSGLLEYCYLRLMNTVQSYYRNDGPEISFEAYKNHSFIYAADLSASSVMVDGVLPLLKSGSLRIRIDFKNVTKKNWNIVCMGYFPSLLTIDNNRQVLVSTLK